MLHKVRIKSNKKKTISVNLTAQESLFLFVVPKKSSKCDIYASYAIIFCLCMEDLQCLTNIVRMMIESN